jgi:LPS-assembly protein
VGPVKFVCDDTTVFADEITWDEKTMRASGSVLVIQEGLRVTADRAEMDRTTRLGTFYKAAGTARLTDKDIKPSMFGTLEPEVSFYAEKLEKLAPRKYRLTDGWFSTCLQANPRWDMRGSSGTITLDEYVLLKNAVLRVKGVPVIYLPMLYYPLGEDDRSTGFLLPTYSASSVRGQGISNSFFWAISRSMDATFYHDYFSKSGQGFGGDYEFVSGVGSRGNRACLDDG